MRCKEKERKERSTTYVPKRLIGLAQRLQVGGLRFPALEHGLPPLDPLDGRGGAEEDPLRLEAAGARVDDHALRFR